jgi:hypothetical protein
MLASLRDIHRYESTLTDHGRVLSDDSNTGSWGCFFERTYQGAHSDRLRATAAILAFFARCFASAALGALSSGLWLQALCYCAVTLVFSFMMLTTLLTLRRRSLARRRGIRFLAPIEGDRDLATPAAEG